MRSYNDQLRKSGTGAFRTGLEALPTAALVGVGCLLAWRTHGSVASGDWVGWGLGVVLLLAVVTTAGAVRRPSRLELTALAALVLLGLWTAVSLAWSPLPALARDEALLVGLYAATLAVPALTLRTRESRLAALALLVLALGAVAVAAAAELRYGDGQLAAYGGSGRLYFPISYVNAQAAFVLVGFWPAVALAARRATPLPLRALSIAAASALLAVGTMTQSRGGAAALAVSTVIVLAVVPARLRLAVATLVPVGVVAALFDRLTEPYAVRALGDGALESAIRGAGGAGLLAAAGGLAAGAVYAAADGRVTLRPRTIDLVGRAAALLVVAVLAGGASAVAATAEEPRDELSERWAAFKQEPTTYETGTHFLAPGSNRYDFWRVALLELRDDPVRGAGARGFGPAYLVRGASDETPARTHSLPLEVLAETGVVGFALFAVAFAALLAGLVARRALVPAAAALAGASYWLAHASVDWTWTFPACGIPFFTLLGIGLARDGASIPSRPAAAAGAAIAVAGLLAFAPPWLTQRYLTAGAAAGLPAGKDDLDRARMLDPLLTDPLVVEAQLVPPAQAVPLLEKAVEAEPRSVRNRFLLGLALLDAGRPGEARRTLEEARALYPRSRAIADALSR